MATSSNDEGSKDDHDMSWWDELKMIMLPSNGDAESSSWNTKLIKDIVNTWNSMYNRFEEGLEKYRDEVFLQNESLVNLTNLNERLSTLSRGLVDRMKEARDEHVDLLAFYENRLKRVEVRQHLYLKAFSVALADIVHGELTDLEIDFREETEYEFQFSVVAGYANPELMSHEFQFKSLRPPVCDDDVEGEEEVEPPAYEAACHFEAPPATCERSPQRDEEPEPEPATVEPLPVYETRFPVPKEPHWKKNTEHQKMKLMLGKRIYKLEKYLNKVDEFLPREGLDFKLKAREDNVFKFERKFESCGFALNSADQSQRIADFGDKVSELRAMWTEPGFEEDPKLLHYEVDKRLSALEVAVNGVHDYLNGAWNWVNEAIKLEQDQSRFKVNQLEKRLAENAKIDDMVMKNKVLMEEVEKLKRSLPALATPLKANNKSEVGDIKKLSKQVRMQSFLFQWHKA